MTVALIVWRGPELVAIVAAFAVGTVTGWKLGRIGTQKKI